MKSLSSEKTCKFQRIRTLTVKGKEKDHVCTHNNIEFTIALRPPPVPRASLFPNSLLGSRFNANPAHAGGSTGQPNYIKLVTCIVWEKAHCPEREFSWYVRNPTHAGSQHLLCFAKSRPAYYSISLLKSAISVVENIVSKH